MSGEKDMIFTRKKKIKMSQNEKDIIKEDVIISKLEEKEIKNAIEGARINILLGAGFTANLYKQLNTIEQLYTKIEDINNECLKDIIM